MIELTLKFKDPKVDGLPKESCECIVFTDNSYFRDLMFSAKHGLFNCCDFYTKKEAEDNKIDNIVFYAEIFEGDENIKTISKMQKVAVKEWYKRNGFEE